MIFDSSIANYYHFVVVPLPAGMLVLVAIDTLSSLGKYFELFSLEEKVFLFVYTTFKFKNVK